MVLHRLRVSGDPPANNFSLLHVGVIGIAGRSSPTDQVDSHRRAIDLPACLNEFGVLVNACSPMSCELYVP